MTYTGEPTILRVDRDQANRMFALAEQPSGLGWFATGAALVINRQRPRIG